MNNIRHWSSDYLGLSFTEGGAQRSGVSCWGLISLVYQEQLGINLPGFYGEACEEELRQATLASLDSSEYWPWHNIDETEVRPFDLVTFKLGRVESHIGLVRRRGEFIHVAHDITSRVERYNEGRWKPLIGRFLRHRFYVPEIAVEPVPLEAGKALILPSLDLGERFSLTVPLGSTIADAVSLALPGLAEAQYNRVRVLFDNVVVPQKQWSRIKPKAWDKLFIRVIPGANDLLRSALLIAVTVAALAIGQLELAPALTATGLFSANAVNFLSAVGTGALALGGGAIVNALVPIRPPVTLSAGQIYAIDGLQNTATPEMPVPNVFGELRFAPPYAAFPYSETVGDDRYIRVAFLLGYGPLDLSNYAPRIGLTDLTEFTDYEIEYREGYDTDDPLTLYHQQVIEESLSIDLPPPQLTGVLSPQFVPGSEQPQIRASARDITHIQVEIFFPGGMILYDSNGGPHPISIDIQAQYRAIGSSTWLDVIGAGMTRDGVLTISAGTLTPFWRMIEWDVPRGQYEIKLTKYSIYSDSDAVSGNNRATAKCTWVTSRGFRPEYPFNYEKPMAYVALRIKASAQLNGTLDTFNIFARRLCPDWNGSSWVTQATSNPASIARLLLQGPQNVFPDQDSELDLAAFEDWHTFCNTKGLTYNAFITDAVTREDTLADICGAGRALPARLDKRTIIIDRPRTEFFDNISTRNSWGLKEADPPIFYPDAYVVPFLDKTYNYIASRRTVPFPGVDLGDVAITEDLNIPGKTDPAEVWIEARRRQYEAIYRRRSWTVNQDIEHLTISRGDAGYLAHPVIDRRQIGGRVRSVSDNTVEIDEFVTMVASGTYKCRFRSSDNSTIEHTIAPMDGTTKLLVITSSGTLPEVGDLASFYSISSPALEVIVKSIERNDTHSGLLTLLPHAPQIDSLTDAEVPPAWDGRIGDITSVPDVAPGIPSITVINTTIALGSAEVFIAAGFGVPPFTYTVAYRHVGGPTFSTVTGPAGAGEVTLTGFALGDTIEVKVLATSFGGTSSLYSDTKTFYIHFGPTADTTVFSADNAILKADSF